MESECRTPETATRSLCTVHQPWPGKDGVSLATQLATLPQPPLLVFTTGVPGRAADAFRLGAVDYLLKPLDPEQVAEAVNRLLAYLKFPKSIVRELELGRSSFT